MFCFSLPTNTPPTDNSFYFIQLFLQKEKCPIYEVVILESLYKHLKGPKGRSDLQFSISKIRALRTTFAAAILERQNASHGYKVEIYFQTAEDVISESIRVFHLLFNQLKDDIIVTGLGKDGPWAGYCIDTWDFKNDKQDFTLANRSASCRAYLKMLQDSEIAPNIQVRSYAVTGMSFLRLHCVV